MGRHASSYPAIGRIASYKLTHLASLFGACLLQAVFAARPSSERHDGQYIAVLQTGAFTRGETRGSERARVRAEQTEGGVDEIITEIEGAEGGAGLDKLQEIITMFAAGSAGHEAEDSKLGAFPTDLSEEQLAPAVKVVYEGTDASARQTALGEEHTTAAIKLLLAKLSETDVTTVKTSLAELKQLEDKELERKRKAEEVAAAREELKELNNQLKGNREDVINQAEKYVENRLKVGDAGKEDARAEEYHLKKLLDSVEQIEQLLQKYDTARQALKFGTYYHRENALAPEYAKRSEIGGEVPHNFDYHQDGKILGPSGDDKDPFIQAGEPNHPKTVGPSTSD